MNHILQKIIVDLWIVQLFLWAFLFILPVFNGVENTLNHYHWVMILTEVIVSVVSAYIILKGNPYVELIVVGILVFNSVYPIVQATMSSLDVIISGYNVFTLILFSILLYNDFRGVAHE